MSGLTALGVGGAVAFAADLTPRDTSIGGVDVGGMRRADAVSTLAATADTASTTPLTVSVAGGQASIDPTAAGLSVDAARSVDAVLGDRFDLSRVWRQVSGGIAVASEPEIDRKALRRALEDVDRQTRREPADAVVTFGPDGPQITAAVTGVSLDLDTAVESVARGWLARSGSLALPVKQTPPIITQQEADRAFAEEAVPAAAGPITVELAKTPGERTVTVTRAALLPTLTMRPAADDPTRLELTVDSAALHAAVLAGDTTLERKPKDAQIVLRDGAPAIIPSVDGVAVDPQKLATAVRDALLTPGRSARVEATVTKPKLTTEKAKALGVTERVSTFSTPLTANVPRTNNLRIAARTVNGTLVMPGDTFSLNKVLGRRTPEKGYSQAPVIYNGRLEMDYGGGVSQMATTVYNNVFFSGLEDVRHKPHSFYISRYPEGREATVSYPSVDLVWRNDSPYAVLVQAGVGSRVSVSFWSTKQYDDVIAEKGPRRNIREPKTIYDEEAGCVAQSPAQGFDVAVRRKVVKDGKTVKDQTWTTTYIAEDRVVCGPEPEPEPTPVPSPRVAGDRLITFGRTG